MEGEYVDLHHLEYALYFEVLGAYTVGRPDVEEEEEEGLEVEADMDDGCDGVDGTSLICVIWVPQYMEYGEGMQCGDGSVTFCLMFHPTE
jgi:hypothetical protein